MMAEFRIKVPDAVDLKAKIPPTLGPYGFYENLLTEGAWLPVNNAEGKVEAKPFIVAVKKADDGVDVSLYGFLEAEEIDGYRVAGTFPSDTTETYLMGADTLAMIKDGVSLTPRETDAKLEALLTRHVHFKDKPVLVVTKRLLEGTYFYDVFDHFPIVFIFGVSESGKTRLLRVFQFGGYHGRIMVDPTAATLFRTKEEEKCTLCIDETEQFSNPKNPIYHTLMTLLNASYSKYSSVPRYDEVGGKRVRKDFHLYGPLVADGTRELPGITMSRSVRVITYKVPKDFPAPKPETFKSLRDEMYYHRLTQAFSMKEIYDRTDVSGFASGRYEEIFRPLFALTEVFGTPEEKESLEEFVSNYERTMRIQAVNLTEEQEVIEILQEYMGSSYKPSGDWWPIKIFTERINQKYGRELHSKTVSSILNRMGLDNHSHRKQGSVAWITKTDMESLVERYGLYPGDGSDKGDGNDEKLGRQERLEGSGADKEGPQLPSYSSSSSPSSPSSPKGVCVVCGGQCDQPRITDRGPVLLHDDCITGFEGKV